MSHAHPPSASSSSFFSFSSYYSSSIVLVDWAAHFGGSIQGCISAVLVLSRELKSTPYVMWILRSLAALAFIVSYMWALVYMLHIMHPSKDFLHLYDQNDDWGR
jgi:hypothetical protein